MKKALFTDTLREIKRSVGRYISILAIIALGCGFFSGVKATMPDMIDTADEMFDRQHLMDLKLVSTVGIRSEDVNAVRNSENVESVAAGYSKDVLYYFNDQNCVLKVMSVPKSSSGMNEPMLIEGRMPEKSGECVVEVIMRSPDTFVIGNSITLTSPSRDEQLSDTLATDTYTIVGIVSSPLYIGFQRDPTNVGNGEINSFIMIPEEDFVTEYYTELYVRFDGLDKYDPFSEEYSDAVAELKRPAVEAFHNSVQKRYDKLKTDAENKLSSAEQQLMSLESVLTMSKADLESIYSAASAEYEVGKATYDAMPDKDNAAGFLARAKLTQAEQQLSMLNDLINGGDEARAKYKAKYDQSKADIESGRQQLENIVSLAFYESDRFSFDDYAAFKGDAEKVDAIAKVFPAFFLLIAALVTLTTMTRMIDEQRTQIGTFKALGYSAGQIVSKYLFYAFSASVVGSVAGTIAGLQIFPSIIFDSYKLLYNIPVLNTPFRPLYMIGCMLASLLCTGAAVLYASMMTLRAQPSELMRPKPPASGRRVLLERAGFIWKRLSFLMKVTIRNLLRYKKRFFMTVFGVAGCTALIITGFGLKHSISSIVDNQFGDVLLYDATVLLNADDNEESAQLFDGLNSFNEITSSMLFAGLSANASGDGPTQSVNLIVPKQPELLDSFINLQTLSDTETTLSDDSVIITEKLSMVLGLSEGDTIRLTPVDGASAEVRIGAVVKNYAMHYIYISPSYYESSFGSEPLYKSAHIFINRNDDEGFTKRIVSDERFLGIRYKDAISKNFLESVKSLDSITLLLIVCAGMLAVIVLYDLANINITERVRELATIKVLGFFDSETSAYIYRENIISTVTGIFLGLGLGRLLHYFVVITSEVDVVLFDRSMIWWADVFGILLTIGFAASVNIVLHFKLKKIDMVESLKSIE